MYSAAFISAAFLATLSSSTVGATVAERGLVERGLAGFAATAAAAGAAAAAALGFFTASSLTSGVELQAPIVFCQGITVKVSHTAPASMVVEQACEND